MSAMLRLFKRRERGASQQDHRRPPIHFLHIGKTGGTAIREALAPHHSLPTHQLFFPGHNVTLRDVPVGDKIVFVVRDPLSRFLSGFNGRLREDRPRYHYPWTDGERVAFEHFTSPDELAEALSADDEGERADAEQAMRKIGHINTSYWYWFGNEAAFRKRLPDFFYVAFQERLTEDFEHLKHKLGAPEEARLPTDATAAHRTPSGFSQELSDTARSNLEHWYARDLEFVRLCQEVAPLVNRA
jgi:hypothetical protein